jgi:DNA topoisomerase-1
MTHSTVPDLVYVSDSDPGITRRKCGRGFTYIAPDGTTIARGAPRVRIEKLAVPPAYNDVWICPRSDGHLQATGRDARRRKQYRYHADWSAAQATTKFEQLAAFGMALPTLRRRVARDLEESDPGDIRFALAAAVAVIDRAALRVGHPDYTDQNGSYGALTLRRRHLRIEEDGIALDFTAKGGKKVRKTITDRTLQKLLHKVSDIPGATLLSWVDDDGTAHSVSSHQLSAYLADAAGDDTFTAKTFRTWAGTLAAFNSARNGTVTLKDMAQAAADRLHNTPAIARKSYIHPVVIALAQDASKSAQLPDVDPVRKSGLFAAEQRLLGLLHSA